MNEAGNDDGRPANPETRDENETPEVQGHACNRGLSPGVTGARAAGTRYRSVGMPAEFLVRIVFSAAVAVVVLSPQSVCAQLSAGFSITTGVPDGSPESAEDCSPVRPDAADELRLTPTGVLTVEFHSVCLSASRSEKLAEATFQVSAYLNTPGNIERLLHVPSWTISERSPGVHVRRSRPRSVRLDEERIMPALPPAVMSMDGTGASVDDALHVTVAETGTGQEFTVRVPVQEQRTHIGLTDSFLFIKRLRPSRHVPDGVNIQAVNFEATPGITHRLQFSLGSPSQRRWLSFGVGYNVSFIDWGGEDKGIGAGPIVTFMDDALQLTFGWALNAQAARMYYGVGFSVVGIR